MGHFVPAIISLSNAITYIQRFLTPLFLVYALKNPDVIKTLLPMLNPAKLIFETGMKAQLVKVYYAGTFIAVLLLMLKNLLNYKIEDYKFLDTKKLALTINPWISYHTNKDTSFTSDFPKVTRETIFVSYNTYQLGEWLELTQGSFKNQNGS